MSIHSIHDRAEAIILRLPCATVARNIMLHILHQQKERGLHAYGEYLTAQSKNLDAVRDSLEELADALCYLLQVEEREQIAESPAFPKLDSLRAVRAFAVLLVERSETMISRALDKRCEK